MQVATVLRLIYQNCSGCLTKVDFATTNAIAANATAVKTIATIPAKVNYLNSNSTKATDSAN